MRGLLDVLGALTLAGGLLGTLLVLMGREPVPAFVPISYAVGGVMSSVVLFALSSVLRRLDDLHAALTPPATRVTTGPRLSPVADN